ncbi:hypothetical protein Tco_0997658 [Tanacetum coccineum]
MLTATPTPKWELLEYGNPIRCVLVVNWLTSLLNPNNDPIVQSVDINTKSTSYAGAAGASAKDQPKVNSNFRTLVVDPVFDGVNISIPYKVVEKVSTSFEHTPYGYFIRKRMVFPVVEYYARNNCVGIKRLHDDPTVTATKLMLLVYKLLLSVFRVNAAITKLQLLKRLRLLEDFLLSEKG